MNPGVALFVAALVGCGASAAALGDPSMALWCVLFLAWELA